VTDQGGQTAIKRLLGPGFGIAAAVLISLVIAGSLLGNSFVAGRMAVAAANKNWLPALFTVVGHLGARDQSARVESTNDHSDSLKRSKSDAPINAIALSVMLSSMYILLGNFRALLTFNGLGEYSFFFFVVLGAIILRYREPDLRRPYKPWVIIPVAFAIVSGLVVVRGAVFAPIQTFVLLCLWASGLIYYWFRSRSAT
jgi:solute carrier family 7 (L-type amino acid transporter), member 9/15